MLGKLIFGGQSWLIVSMGLFLLGLILVIWRYAQGSIDGVTRWLAPLCKITGLLLLAVCLLEPLWNGQRVRSGANLFVVLADDSQSLTMRDPGASTTWGEQLKHLLNVEQEGWQVRLGQDFDLRRYQFNSRLQSVPDFSGLDFQGSQTSLVAVLNGLKERFRDRPLAGVLLFTDGVATDANDLNLDLGGLPPVYSVALGMPSLSKAIPDLSVSHLTLSETAFEDAPITIQADVTSTAMPTAKVTAEVIDEGGIVVQQQTQAISNDSGTLPFRFQIRPTKSGVSFYEVRVRKEDEAGKGRTGTPAKEEGAAQDLLVPLEDASSIEPTLANNRRLIAVDRGSTKYRILYLCGRPNWEYKYLKRAIDSDEQIQLTGVIRIARKEPKFDWRSKAGEVSNPLFRGFEGKTEETERYDQPVLVRLNTKTPEELADGFPKTLEELYEFHAVVIDDLEAEFFSPDQLSLLERFVSERGGGLLMLGGAESFRQGGYERTPVGRMLPISLTQSSAATTSTGYRLSLTREGWLQPWARLRSTETEEQQRLLELPNFLTLNRGGNVKPGATVIAEAVDASGQQLPGLIVQPFGRGRSAAMMLGDLWRWQLDRTNDQREKDDLGKAWRQTVRWLIADVPERVELRPVPKADLGVPLMRLEARIRTKEFLPQDNASVTVTVKLPDGTVASQPGEPSLQEPGLYEATFAARLAGRYRAEVEVIDQEGERLARAETGWAVDPSADEFAQVTPNVAFLKRIAERTSGEVVPLDGLERFVASLAGRKAPLTEAYTIPLWHQPWMLGLIVACLCAEWGLRRWKGLP
ncbi:glutamine amidotransferase [Schlesneria sp. DSM 10557]|uniref:glutamine amidotransferase n=1 Tax=Schlesneria sp. DSM 10557 TaxID=3044399 RepID=UPI0035A0EC5A